MSESFIPIRPLLALPDEVVNDCKIHFAKYNGDVDPLDLFLNNPEEIKGWNEWRGDKNDFNKTYIFTVVQFPKRRDRWLFVGIYKVIKRYDDYGDTEHGYDVELTDLCKDLIGRLIINYYFNYPHGRSVRMDNYIDSISIAEILPSKYDGIQFPGFDSINITYSQLQTIVKADNREWRTALQSIYAIYLIVDQSTGKQYVGSASGGGGLWKRWSDYIYSKGSGDNVGLNELLDGKPDDYAEKNYKFTLLEFFSTKVSEDFVISRENFWKEALLTRAFGLNRN